MNHDSLNLAIAEPVTAEGRLVLLCLTTLRPESLRGLASSNRQRRPLLLDWRPSLLALMAKRPLRCLFQLFQRSVPFTPGLNNFSLEVTWK